MKEKGYIIPHTHWDREWRYPIWKNRVLLIEFMEQLLDILDKDKDYNCFLLDGQVAPILDYLEVAPYDKARVRKHIKTGRIAIGPWYTLPDLYPIGAECLVRNLLLGKKICEDLGDILKVGYTSFGWGQTAQLPQIYKGFGMDFIICAKKVSKKRAPQSEFMWESPDGTKVLTTRLGEFARANFFFNAYIDVRYDVKFLSDEFVYSPQKSGMAVHDASPNKASQDYFLIKPQTNHNYKRLKEGINIAWRGTDDTALKETRLFLNGCDFSTPQPDLTELIKQANNLFENKTFVNARLEEYAKDLQNLDKDKLVVVKGELRDGPSCDCSGNALATRIPLKQLNKKAQNMLIGKAEPLNSIWGMMGNRYPKDFFDIAWKNMLQSHAHDSINGVVQDKTADDVLNRLNQALEIGEVLYEKAVNNILQEIDYSAFGESPLILTVFNPLYTQVSDVIKLVVDTHREENIWSFDIVNSEGEKLEIQHISREEYHCPVHDLDGRPWPIYTDRHICMVNVQDLPPMGYTSYKIVKKSEFKRNHHYWKEMRQTAGNEICKQDNVLENEYLKVSFNTNGTFDLQDKQNGKQFTSLHYFEDSGDVGNYWAYYPPYNNKTYNTLGCAPKIWLEENGALCATIGVQFVLELPAWGCEPEFGVRGSSIRSNETKELRITSLITLKKNSKTVDISTTLKNNVKNHRLRVAFPTFIDAEYSYSAGHFTVDKRPVISTKNKEGLYYNEMQTLPIQEFVDISANNYGIAFLNNCLTEFEVTKAHAVYLTLFRAMGNMIVTGWESVGRFPEQEGSQLLQEMSFEYSLYPHLGDWMQANVYHQAQKANNPPTFFQVMGRCGKKFPPNKSFISIANKDVVVSAFKKAENTKNYILRLFNPTNIKVTTDIKLCLNIKQAWYTRLDEQREKEIDLKNNNTITAEVGQNKIVTLEVCV